jgi:plasmid stability protein
MATITIKNIPNELYDNLKTRAALNRRSVSNEIIFCIENSLKSRKIQPDEFIQELEVFYQNVDIPLLTDEKLKEYKETGRL